MKRLLFIIIAALIAFNLSAQEQTEEIFKSKYAVLLNEFNPNGSKKVNNANIEQFREQYKRLQEGLKEIEMFEYNVLTEGNIFTDKELKSLDKENQVDDLENMLKKYSEEMKIFLGENDEFGIGKEDCLKTYSNLKHCIERKDNDAAFIYWREMFKYFPKYNNAYSKGDFLVCQKIKESIGDNKEFYIDTLLLLYDQRIKYLGNNKKYGTGYSNGKKGSYLYKYRKESALNEAYKLLKESIEIQQESSSCNVVKDFFDANTDMINGRRIEPEEFVNNYIVSIEVLKGSTKKYSDLIDKEKNKTNPAIKNIENWEIFITNNIKVSEYINKKFASSEPAKCEYLIPAFKDNFNKNKTDTVWLKKVSGILSWKECTNDPFYREVLIELYSLNPSANTAALIGALYLKERKYTEALKFFKEAYEKEQDPNKKAEFYYNAAYISYLKNNYLESRSLARKAIEYKGNFGKPYILIARLYAGSYASCGTEDFEKAAVYWVAVDKLIKAKNVDPACEKEANELIIKYKKKFPNKEIGFMKLIYEGNVYKVNCWIQENTSARY